MHSNFQILRCFNLLLLIYTLPESSKYPPVAVDIHNFESSCTASRDSFCPHRRAIEALPSKILKHVKQSIFQNSLRKVDIPWTIDPI